MRPKYMIIFLICLLVLSGCKTGKRELSELALVMVVGLDKGSKDEKIKITTQIARPADARGQTGAPSGQIGDPIWSASAEGETIFEAIRNLSTFSSRRVFWAHNLIIVINEDLARDGISDIIDFFTRNPELRMRTWVVVTPNEASQVVSTMTGLEVVPGEALDKLFRYTSISVQAPRTQMIDLQAAYLSVSTQPVLARVHLINRGVSNKKPGQAGAYKQVELAGAGIFKGDKLVGYIKPIEVRAMIPFIEPLDTGMLVLPCPDDKHKKLTVELKGQKFNVTPSYKNNTPSFRVSYQTKASVVEAACPFALEERAKVKALEQEIEKEKKKEFEKVVKLAKSKYKSDFLKFGKTFNNKYPVEWRKLGPNWEAVFPNVVVKVDTKAKVNDTVLLKKQTKPGSVRN